MRVTSVRIRFCSHRRNAGIIVIMRRALTSCCILIFCIQTVLNIYVDFQSNGRSLTAGNWSRSSMVLSLRGTIPCLIFLYDFERVPKLGPWDCRMSVKSTHYIYGAGDFWRSSKSFVSETDLFRLWKHEYLCSLVTYTNVRTRCIDWWFRARSKAREHFARPWILHYLGALFLHLSKK